MTHHTYKHGVRYHKTPIGEVPGVTSILSWTKKDRDKQSIKSWQDRVGKEVSEGILKNAVDRGNELHKLIQSYLTKTNCFSHNTQAQELFKLVKPYLESIREDTQKAMLVERHTYSKLGFGGTPDLITEENGKPIILDWKNSRRPKKRAYIQDYLQQIAAYRQSTYETFGLEVNRAYIVCAVYPDPYLEITNPGLVVEPELQIFKVTKRQLDIHWNNFKERLDTFHSDIELMEKLNGVDLDW